MGFLTWFILTVLIVFAKTIRTVSINQVKKPIYQSSVNSSDNFSKYLKNLNQLKDI